MVNIVVVGGQRSGTVENWQNFNPQKNDDPEGPLEYQSFLWQALVVGDTRITSRRRRGRPLSVRPKEAEIGVRSADKDVKNSASHRRRQIRPSKATFCLYLLGAIVQPK